MNVTWALEKPLPDVISSAASISAGPAALSRSSSRGPVAGVNGNAACSLG
jgi:hypothetical protein